MKCKNALLSPKILVGIWFSEKERANRLVFEVYDDIFEVFEKSDITKKYLE